MPRAELDPQRESSPDVAGCNEPGGESARGIVGLLVDRYYGGIFWGKFFSFAAAMVHSLVISIMAFDAVGSSVAVALVNAAMFAPQIVLGPWSGAGADRGLAVVQIVVGRGLSGIGAGVLAVWVALDGAVTGWSAVVVIAASAGISGVGLALSAAAMNSLVPQLVSRRELPLAMSLNTIPLSVARVAGPVAGAFVLAAAGTDAALWGAAIGHVLFALTVMAVRPPAGARRPRSADGSVRAAWDYIRRQDPILLRLLVAITLVGFASEPVFILAPSYADGFGGGATLVGVLCGSFGIGAGVGLVLSIVLGGRQPHARLAIAGFLLMGVGSVLAAALTALVLANVAFGLVGLGFTLSMTGVSTLLQLRVPDELRGRVMGLWMIGFVGGRPVTGFLVGAIADLSGARVSFGVIAAITLAAAWWCRPARLSVLRPQFIRRIYSA